MNRVFVVALILQPRAAAAPAERDAEGAEDANQEQDGEQGADSTEWTRAAQSLTHHADAGAWPEGRCTVSLKHAAMFELSLGRWRDKEACGPCTMDRMAWRERVRLAAIAALRVVPPWQTVGAGSREFHPQAFKSRAREILRICKPARSLPVQEAGMSALCRITPLSSLSLQDYENFCGARDAAEGGEHACSSIHWQIEQGICRVFDLAACKCVLATMRRWPASAAVQRAGCRVLAAVARLKMPSGNVRDQLVKLGAIGVVFAALARSKHDARLQACAHAALLGLLATRSSRPANCLRQAPPREKSQQQRLILLCPCARGADGRCLAAPRGHCPTPRARSLRSQSRRKQRQTMRFPVSRRGVHSTRARRRGKLRACVPLSRNPECARQCAPLPRERARGL